MLKQIVEKSSIYGAKKIIQSSMNSHLNIKYINHEIDTNIDKDRDYLLYIHVPFCKTFCPYCSFHKFMYDKEKAKDYFFALRKEMRKIKDQGAKFNSLYIGGGTTLIDEVELLKTLELAKKLFDIENVSCESDPGHIALSTIKNLEGLVKRLSVGVQSFDDRILKKIARYDKFGSAEKIQERLCAIQGTLPIVNIDLIFNFPGQNKELILNDLQIAKDLNVEQITTYPLMNTKLTSKSILKAFHEKSSSNEYALYRAIQHSLSSYYPNNAWSFSKQPSNMSDEYLAKHNEYIGLGSGAFSFLNNTLYVNAYSLNSYANLVQTRRNSIVAASSFALKQKIQYHFLTWIFNGIVDIKKFDEAFGCDSKKILKKELFMLRKIGAIESMDDKVYPTEFGKYLSLVMMKEFYSGMDSVRAMFRKTMKE